MNITDDLLSINHYSRSGHPLIRVKALVIHWIANPRQSAKDCRNFFESRKDGQHDGYGSAHYVIDLDGSIVRCIPESEIAFHCGSSKLDPASGKTYTDIARKKFGVYATDYVNLSPNCVTLGVEHCHTDWLGSMTGDTIASSIELAADICKRCALDPYSDILLHKEIVGWKDCHKYFVDNPDAWESYKAQVSGKMKQIRY